MGWVLPQVFDFLLVVEHHPALCTKYLSVRLGLDVLYLQYEVFPLFAILFNHNLFNNLRDPSPYYTLSFINFTILTLIICQMKNIPKNEKSLQTF